MSIDTWTEFVAEFQQYLAVFDAPTRYFLYALSIGITILSLSFSYYMTKISFELVAKVLEEIFGFLKKILVDLPVESLKVAFKREKLLIVKSPVESPAQASVEA